MQCIIQDNLEVILSSNQYNTTYTSIHHHISPLPDNLHAVPLPIQIDTGPEIIPLWCRIHLHLESLSFIINKLDLPHHWTVLNIQDVCAF